MAAAVYVFSVPRRRVTLATNKSHNMVGLKWTMGKKKVAVASRQKIVKTRPPTPSTS